VFSCERSVWTEQAFLGAVLLDPAGQHRLLDLVEPGDMYRPWHAQVLAAMRRARGRGALPGLAEAYRELQNDPDLPRTVAADAVPLASLMEAAPRPEHAPAYASMVVEGGIRRWTPQRSP
jgi:replicative DNA helicase